MAKLPPPGSDIPDYRSNVIGFSVYYVMNINLAVFVIVKVKNKIVSLNNVPIAETEKNTVYGKFTRGGKIFQSFYRVA